MTVLRGVCSSKGCLSGATCYTTTVVHSGAPFACMPLRVAHFWLKSTAVWESVAIVLLSLALQAPVMLFPLFSSIAELIPQGSGVLRAFISKSVEQLLLVILQIYHLKDAQSVTHFTCNTEQIWEAGGRQAAVLWEQGDWAVLIQLVPEQDTELYISNNLLKSPPMFLCYILKKQIWSCVRFLPVRIFFPWR